jgi:hypothetical protein
MATDPPNKDTVTGKASSVLIWNPPDKDTTTCLMI